MTEPRATGRHLDTRTALDYLEDMLPAQRRRAVEEHLGSPCPDCHERVRVFGGLIETMRGDLTPEVPATLRERALAVFQPIGARVPLRRRVEAAARLLFDSWTAPLPAAARRAVGEVRRLRFALGEDALELECEPEGRGTVSVRGWLRSADPALWRVELAARAERRTALPDAHGAFALDRVPAGRVRLTVTGPGVRYQLGALTL
ncbi:MAG: hypothetical protein HZC42_05825 [Candidatus Eisenbacteria bacterium]|nr:hypothetical protein [Candidatus Eisenbacteria bacterium]